MNKNILIGGAWPYANGSLHIGHIAGLLPGDVLARYHRACGDKVYFVSGSDCHGTPVAIRAKSEGKTPREISDHYHEEFVDCFNRLGFSYDCYTKTSDQHHKDFIREFHEKLYKSEYVYEKETPQAFCECCNTFLADRFVTGICPKCGQPTRGDQCDLCGTVLDPESLKNAIEGVFDAVRRANKFFDENEPWKARTADEAACRNTLYQCVQIIANLAVILAPFLPFSSDKVCKWLNISSDWSYKEVKPGYVLPEIQILFERLDKKVIEEERDKLSIS